MVEYQLEREKAHLAHRGPVAVTDVLDGSSAQSKVTPGGYQPQRGNSGWRCIANYANTTRKKWRVLFAGYPLRMLYTALVLKPR